MVEGHPEILNLVPVREVVTARIGDVVERIADTITNAGGGTADIEAIRNAAAGLFGLDPGPDSLGAVLTRAAFPLLAPAIDGGHHIDRVPEVLTPLLRAPDVRAGSRALFGRVTRPLIRAVARRLDPDGPPAFAPLVLAAMAAGTCGPERLTEIIETDPSGPWPISFSHAEVSRARSMFLDAPPRRVTTVLQRALVNPASDAPELAAQIAAWSPPPPPPPIRVEFDPETAPPAPPLVTPSPSDGGGRRRIVYPPAWTAAEGVTVADHTVALPRDVDDLRHWGTVMGNCLGSFGAAAEAGASRILGLVRTRELRYVVEITRGGTIRQIEARGNRQPDRHLGIQIARHLIDLGLAVSDGRTGRSLLAPRHR